MSNPSKQKGTAAETAVVRYARDNLRHARTTACLLGDENSVALLRVLAEMHSPGTGYDESCQGCRREVSGYEYDMEPWPCATFLAIEADAHD